MFDVFAYPYPSYVPNRIIASCVAAVAGISLVAWFIQSCQVRFQPRRLSILLLLSHIAIVAEFILRAALPEQLNSKNMLLVATSLFAIGQRMIIVSTYAFVFELQRVKSRLSRVIFAGVVLCVVTSGLLMAPANMFAFQPDKRNASFLFRTLSASILLLPTVVFYPVWYWTKTMKDMPRKALVLMFVSSALCLIVAVFMVVESTAASYDNINSREVWFYAFQIAPIVIAHCTWSIFHPKRSLVSTDLLLDQVNMETSA